MIRWLKYLWFGFLAATSVDAKKAYIVNDSVESAAIKRDLARNAQKSIYVSMYMFKADRTGLQTLSEFRDAALRGIDVHLMIDALYLKKLPASVVQSVLAAGVHLYSYNPFNIFNPAQYLKRSHDKVWVIDGEWTDVGDRNVANEYAGLSKDPSISRGIIVQDQETAQSAEEYIKESFKLKNVRELKPGQKVRLIEEGSEILAKAKANAVDRYFVAYTHWRDKLRSVDDVQFNHTGIGSRDSPLGLDATLLEDLRNAQHKIIIENPYIILVPEYLEVLKQKLSSGVRVEIYTNSKFSSDNRWVSAAWEQSRLALATYGAEIYEHPGVLKKRGFKEIKARLQRLTEGKIDRLARSRSFLHAKSAVIDDTIAYLMSYNMDPRSKNLNREVSIRLKSKHFAVQLKRQIRDDARRLKYLVVAKWGSLSAAAPTCSALMRYLTKFPLLRRQL